MHTISAIARNASLPRRTVQYWHDRGVIEPLSRSPVVYSDDELIVARLLTPFVHMTASVRTLKELSRIFRLMLSDDDSVPGDVRGAFNAAKAQGRGYLFVAPQLGSDGQSVWVWTSGAQNLDQAPAAIGRMLDARPYLAPATIDLGYALNTEISVGVAFFQNTEDDN